MTNYPTNIRILDAATFTETSEDTSVSLNDTEGGYLISRPKFTRKPRRVFTFKYTTMSDDDKLNLLNFWELVRGQSNSFTWQHPISDTIYTVRFHDMDKLSFKRIGFGPNNIWESDTIILKEV